MLVFFVRILLLLRRHFRNVEIKTSEINPHKKTKYYRNRDDNDDDDDKDENENPNQEMTVIDNILYELLKLNCECEVCVMPVCVNVCCMNVSMCACVNVWQDSRARVFCVFV